MNILALYNALCARFPEAHRVSYDLDGLQLCPDKGREVRRIVTALDVTSDCVRAAREAGADLILTHHPIFFSAVRTLAPESSMDADNASALLCAGIAHISLHTRFDAGRGGINDTLAERLGLSEIAPFGLPEDPIPLGRIGTLEAVTPGEFALKAASLLGTHVLLTEGKRPVKTVAVIGGAAGDYLELFLRSEADLLLTGEISHHRRIAAAECKKSVVEAGHFGSEILFCEAIGRVLGDIVPEAEVISFPDTAHEICVLPNK